VDEVVIEAPEVPQQIRSDAVETCQLERPMYQIYLYGTATVEQPSLLVGEYNATESKMLARDDRVQKRVTATSSLEALC
jgi:hypothetical protein